MQTSPHSNPVPRTDAATSAIGSTLALFLYAKRPARCPVCASSAKPPDAKYVIRSASNSALKSRTQPTPNSAHGSIRNGTGVRGNQTLPNCHDRYRFSDSNGPAENVLKVTAACSVSATSPQPRCRFFKKPPQSDAAPVLRPQSPRTVPPGVLGGLHETSGHSSLSRCRPPRNGLNRECIGRLGARLRHRAKIGEPLNRYDLRPEQTGRVGRSQ